LADKASIAIRELKERDWADGGSHSLGERGRAEWHLGSGSTLLLGDPTSRPRCPLCIQTTFELVCSYSVLMPVFSVT
jgi:hypothetical protein